MSIPLSVFIPITLFANQPAPAAANFGRPMGVYTHAVAGGRLQGPYANVADVKSAGHADGSGPVRYAEEMFRGENPASSIMIGQRLAADTNMAATLTAIAAEETVGKSFFGITIESRDIADVLSAETWLSSQEKIGIFQSDDATILSATANNEAAQLQARASNNAAMIYNSVNTELSDVAYLRRGLAYDLDVRQGKWYFNALGGGVTATVVNQTQLANAAGTPVLVGEGCNLYIATAGGARTVYGRMSGGRFIDAQTTIYWALARIRERVFNVLANDFHGLNYSNEDAARIVAAANTVMSDGEAGRHFDVDAENIFDQVDVRRLSATQRQSRILPITGRFTTAGGIIQVTTTLNINLQ